MNLFEIIAALLAGYLLGSISFAVIVARRHGIDILKVGSGNPGATNVKRVVGKKAGNLVFALDFLKGLIAAGWPLLPILGAESAVWAGMAGLVGAILGHSFSIFLRFKGGKGVAVTMGGLFALLPVVTLIGLLVWVVVFYTSRYVSLASLAFGVSLPLAALVTARAWPLMVLTVLVAVLIVYRHRGNIQRLRDGTESRFSKPSRRGKS